LKFCNSIEPYLGIVGIVIVKSGIMAGKYSTPEKSPKDPRHNPSAALSSKLGHSIAFSISSSHH